MAGTAAIYFMPLKEDDAGEMDKQLAKMREYCAGQGLNVVGEYKEEEAGSRQEFNRLMEDVRRRRVGTIVFWSLDRFSREGPRKAVAHLEKIDSCGVKFQSCTELYLSNFRSFGTLMIKLLETLERQIAVSISNRTIEGLEVAKKQGKQLGRPPLNEKNKTKIIEAHKAEGTELSIGKLAEKLKMPKSTVHKILKTLAK
ncbi:MAG: recombinase family protein [Dissulfurispiraceae bacterium]|jgi:DNA invertase Pin-like site-specific DNA recombinase